ncbi:hypothetical protein NPIL_241721 [Nephila pilipes]|uniref:Uncharacterized protein n=1 Tax=Nephila pilipes TaxID=299642 RepID=A0A8X6JYR0_NEPPI|nr:hypothetical protein NPIL_241721 [Nephila pilipes]
MGKAHGKFNNTSEIALDVRRIQYVPAVGVRALEITEVGVGMHWICGLAKREFSGFIRFRQMRHFSPGGL